MYIPVTPLPKPRMTQRDKWKQRPVVMAYRQYKDDLRGKIEDVPNELWIVFVLPLPKSWPKKRKLAYDGIFHQQKPDIDNLVKGFLDALLIEDQQVYEVHALKLWGSNPGIYLGEEHYASLSKAIKDKKEGQSPVQAEKKTPRGVARQRNLRVRGVSPRVRRG